MCGLKSFVYFLLWIGFATSFRFGSLQYIRRNVPRTFTRKQPMKYFLQMHDRVRTVSLPESHSFIYKQEVVGKSWAKINSWMSSLISLTLIKWKQHTKRCIFVFTVGWILVKKLLKDQKYSKLYSGEVAVYDQRKIHSFYSRRPWLVVARLAKMLWISMGFNVRLLMDCYSGRLEVNERHRARELANILCKLGPTYVKLGQALSIRTDILPEAYCTEMKKLQDSVTQFSTLHAMDILKDELGISDVSDVFSYVSNEPVASASIGQVYKAKLLNGLDVAVKIQRPSILDDITLDLHLLRKFAPIQVKIINMMNGNATMEKADIDMAHSLVDEWGRGLVAELDYRTEAKNTMQFIEAMKIRGLNAVTSPSVISELSTNKIIVTEWIEGARLDKDCSPDVPRLCGLALNAYLTMLLDTGTLHCDPHPGNLLRTKDGRLNILDWGMTLSLPQDLQYSLLEFISHIQSEDYGHLPDDLVKLGATPPDKIEDLRRSGIVDGFSFILKQFSKGGGARKITENLRSEFKARYGDFSDDQLAAKARVEVSNSRSCNEFPSHNGSVGGDANGIIGLLEMVSQRNRHIFRIPSYMLYVMRAFTTLEGIGLSINPDYSIFQECYPYLAKRLMTDDSPRSKAALRNMVYKDGRLKTEKLLKFSEGFTNYTASTADVDYRGVGIEKAQKALTDLLLDSRGNSVQELLMEGAARFADSVVRVAIDNLVSSPGGKLAQFIVETPKSVVEFMVPDRFKPFLLPVTLPYELSKALINLVQKDDYDQANVQSLRLLWENLEPKLRQQLKDLLYKNDKNGLGFIMLPLSLMDSALIRSSIGNAVALNDKIPVILKLSRKFGATVLNQTAQRLDSKVRDIANDEFEVELLLTEQIGSISSATVKSLANVLDSPAR